MASQEDETDTERQDNAGASRTVAAETITHTRHSSDLIEPYLPSDDGRADASNIQLRGPPITPYDTDCEPQAPVPVPNIAISERPKEDIAVAASPACPEPPVTKTTLSELDVPRIVYNPKLRHDVNFDPDLHFRPNLDGESGRRKANKASEFWSCLRVHLHQFVTDPVGFERLLDGRPWCLPITLRAVREILGTLVPPEDRQSVEDMLDVEFLMQQFRKGVADLEKLALWLSMTLKSHCAPMRDEWVDDMAKLLTIGHHSGDIETIVRGLQSLLGVLEAMKLDVANHQIRCLRPLLIKDTVEFERTFFNKKMTSGKIMKAPLKKWFDGIRSYGSEAHQPSTLSNATWAFFIGLTNFIFSAETSEASNKLPESFVFDEERFVKLRSDILDAINLDVCLRLRLPNSVSGVLCPAPDVTLYQPEEDTQALGLQSGRRSPQYMSYTGRVSGGRVPAIQIIEDSTGDGTDSDCSSSDYDTEDAENEDDDSEDDGFIRIPKIGSRTSTAMTTPLFRSVEIPCDPQRQSILDIVDNAPLNNRWQQSVPYLAAQLARQHDFHRAQDIESQLVDRISNPQNNHFKESRSRVFEALTFLLATRVNLWFTLSSTELFEIAASPKPPPGQPPKTRHSLPEIATLLAHIGIIHWRVWADAVYLADDEVSDGSALPTAGGVVAGPQ